MNHKRRKKYVLALLKIVFLFIFFLALLPYILHVDIVRVGINQHCGFYNNQNELHTPCKCLGKWTKGKILVEDKDDYAYCQGIMGFVYLN